MEKPKDERFQERMVMRSDMSVQLMEDTVWTSNGVRLTPDEFTAYFDVRYSHAWPTVMSYGNCFHPQTIANSFHRMVNKVVNIDHMVRSYDAEQISRDRIVGTVLSAEYPGPELGGKMKVYKDYSPYIRSVLSIHKQAQGVDKIIGQHQSGRRTWSVSMEMLYSLELSGFLVSDKVTDQRGLLQIQSTPLDLRDTGFYYIPWTMAPQDLKDCWDKKKTRIKSKWRDADTYLMQGGLDGEIFYMGIALTETPAESVAAIDRMVASDPERAEEEAVLAPIRNAIESLKNHLISN